MKTIFNGLKFCLLFAALMPLALSAPEAPPKNGFVRLANAVAIGTGNLTMEIDGKKTDDAGYSLGEVTGGISLPLGNRTIKFIREGVKEGSTRVSVVGNETTILIPFAEKVPATDEVPAHWEIRILRLKQRDPEEDRSASFVSVSQNPEIKVEMRDPDGKWSNVFVKRLAVAQAPIRYPRGYVPIKTADGALTSIPVSSNGNYVVLLYDDEQGKVKSVNFRDRKFLSAD